MDKANLTGLSEFDAQILALVNDLERQLPNIVARSAETIRQEIDARTPVDTGSLLSNIDAVEQQRTTGASATVQVDNSAKDGNEHYAIYQEFGTSKMPARPFFRPGVQAAMPVVQVQITSDILNIVASYGG